MLLKNKNFIGFSFTLGMIFMCSMKDVTYTKILSYNLLSQWNIIQFITLFNTLLILPLLNNNRSIIPITKTSILNNCRFILSLGGIYSIILSISSCTLTNLTIIEYLVPLISSGISYYFYGEEFYLIPWVLSGLMIVGLIGNIPLTMGKFVVISALSFALCDVITKYYLVDHMNFFNFYFNPLILFQVFNLITFPWGLLPLVLNNIPLLFYIIMLGIFDMILLYCVFRSLRSSSISKFMALKYTNVIFSSINDYYFMGKNVVMLPIILAIGIIMFELYMIILEDSPCSL